MSVRKNREASRRPSVMLKLMFQKLQRRFLLVLASRVYDSDEAEAATVVPEDVPEGHFVVLALEGEEAERFVVELGYLTEPAFLRLLEKAKEEYGFKQKGALSVPCRPQDLQRILNRKEVNGAVCAAPCNTPILESF